MDNFLSQLKKATLGVAIVSIIIGLAFVIFPSMSLKIICIIIGVLFILCGVVLCGMYFFSTSAGAGVLMFGELVFGVILAVFGIVICVKSQTFISIIQFVIGAFVLAEGIINFVRSIQIKLLGSGVGIFSLVCSIGVVILGIVLLIDPFESAKTFTVIVGISLMIYGVIDLITALKVSSLKKAEEVDDNVVYVQNDTDYTEEN